MSSNDHTSSPLMPCSKALEITSSSISGESPKLSYLPLKTDASRISTHTPSRTHWLCTGEQLQPRERNGELSGGLWAPWGIHWHTPVAIITLLIVGIGTAIAHHFYYWSLDNTEAGDIDLQRWVTRIGTGLAFLFQTSIVAVLQLSRKQWVWLTLRKSTITLGGMDDLFGVTSNPLLFRNTEMFRQAPLATLMAIITWIIPITVVFAPSSITVKEMSNPQNTTCSVPAIKYQFDNESTAILYEPQTAYSLAFRNENGYYGPSDVARNTFITGAYNWNEPQQWGSINGCTGLCKYTIKPLLPAVSFFIEETIETPMESWSVPDHWMTYFDHAQILPGQYPIFLAQRDRQNQNTLRIMHTEQLNGTRNDTVRLSLITCRNSISQFTVKSQFYQETITVDYNQLQPEHVGFLDDFNIGEVQQSSMFDASLAFFDVLLYLLEGSVLANLTGDPSRSSARHTISTQITNRTNVGAMLQFGSTILNQSALDLTRVLTWSTFSMAIMPLYWIRLESNADLATDCSSGGLFTGYIYSWTQLAWTYISTTIAAIIVACFGFGALATNGVSSDTNFSTILLTTRNPKLDELTKGGCIGGSPLPERLKGLKMKFGAMKDTAGGDPHVMIGLEEQVVRIEKRGWYS